MSKYSNQPAGFWHLLGQCFAAYPVIFKNTWYLLLLVVVLTMIAVLVFPLNIYVAASILVLMSLAIVFLMAVVIHIGDKVLQGKLAGLNDSIVNAKKRYLAILGGIVLLMLAMAITGVIDFALYKLGEWLGIKALFSIIALGFSFFVGLVFYFVWPLLVLEKQTVLKCFEKSTRLFLGNPWRILGVFLIVHLITFAVSSLGAVFLRWPELSFFYIIYGLLIQFFIYPLIISMVLVLLHDANLRLAAKK